MCSQSRILFGSPSSHRRYESLSMTSAKRISPENNARLLGLLRTPIRSKYCWFGWWLGAWSTPSHDPTQLCDIYISGYKYTLISEWTRLFGLLRILDNLISGAVCYFCTTISVFCEIYTLRMRVVAHTAIVWVGWFFMPSSGVGLVSVPIIGAGTRDIWKFWEGLGRRLGKFCCLWSCVSTVWTSSPVGWLAGLVVGAGPRGWALAAVVSLLVKGRTWTSLSYWVCVADCQPQFTCFGDSEDLGACVMVSTGRWGLCAFCCWC